MGTVVIVPMGDPSRYKPATYVVNLCGERLKVRTRTSLLALASAVPEVERLVAVVLDTLYPLYCREAPDSYEMLRDAVESCIREEIVKMVEESDPEPPRSLIDGLEVVVAPGHGRYGGMVFEGSFHDYYTYVYYELCRLVPPGAGELWLDLTHGLNYMPTLTYKAAVNLAETRMLRGSGLKLRIVNSEPYPPGFRGEPVLHMYSLMVDVEKPEGWRIVERLYSRGELKHSSLVRFKVQSPEDSRRTAMRLREGVDVQAYVRNLKTAAKTVKYALPLAFIEMVDGDALAQAGRIEEALHRVVVGLFNEYTEITMGDQVVHRRMSLRPEAILHHQAAAYASRLYEIHRSLASGPTTLQKIIEFKNWLRAEAPETTTILIDREIREIMMVARRNAERLDEYRTMVELTGMKAGKPDKRTILAHAGLTYNHIEIKLRRMVGEPEPGDILVRYTSQALKEVEQATRR